MKLAIALSGLSLAVMVVMIFQAVRQEISLRKMKNRMVENTAEVKRKEDAIASVKIKTQELKTALESANTKIDELKTKKEQAQKSSQDFDKSLQACIAEKDDFTKKTVDITEALNKIRSDHDEAQHKAHENIQNLKQQILNRDRAICAFADTTKEEARKLCGMAEAQN